jgi:hypothetical protein
MTARHRLPDRRAAESFDLEVAGLRYTATVGFYPDGRIGELFIVNHKAGSEAGIWASDSAIAASIALQFGMPLEVLQHAVRRDAQGRALSPLGVALDMLAVDGGGPC